MNELKTDSALVCTSNMNIVVVACRETKKQEYQDLISLIPNGITIFVDSDAPTKDYTNFFLFLRDKSVEAYKFIVRHFTTPNSVWLLGDAIIIQQVLGMIACGGILVYDQKLEWDDKYWTWRCEEVYHNYQVPLDDYKPDGGYSIVFRLGNSHLISERPVRFAGLVHDIRYYSMKDRIIMYFKLLFSKKCLGEYELQEEDGCTQVKTIRQIFWKYSMSGYKQWKRRTFNAMKWMKTQLLEEINSC